MLSCAPDAFRRGGSTAPVLRLFQMALSLEITPVEVKHLLDSRADLSLIDVREPEEHRICRIDGATLIPMREIPQQFGLLEATPVPLIVFCHHGVRSLTVVSWLRDQGLDDCQSMTGGIDAWSRQVDPTIPRY